VNVLPRIVGIVTRTDREEALRLATQVMDHFELKGIRVLLELKLAAYAGRNDAATNLEDMNVDLIVTIGGDGTILRTCLHIPKPEPPILAIDMGIRGFMTEVSPERALESVDRYLEGNYVLERCSKVASFIGDKRLPDALNEIFVTSRTLAKILNVRIWKDDVPVAECGADGVVVASQVGSTGYSFSGGGPILDPDLDAFVLTPICPITVLRPIVFSAESVVTIELLRPKTATVVIDGQYQVNLDQKDPFIMVKKSEYESSLVRFEGDFYRRLKARLLFSKGESYESE